METNDEKKMTYKNFFRFTKIEKLSTESDFTDKVKKWATNYWHGITNTPQWLHQILLTRDHGGRGSIHFYSCFGLVDDL